MTVSRSFILSGAIAVGAVLLAGCGPPTDGGVVHVNMYDNAYSPPVVHVPVGGEVVFRNVGRNDHHAVALDGAWSTEDTVGTLAMKPGESATVSFTEPGVYRFYCTYHGAPAGDRGMVGAVVVGDVEFDPGGGGDDTVVAAWSGITRRVPRDYERIQLAVDAAEPGDLVLVDRGVYHEQVTVTTPSLTIRGVDRDEVVLDGLFQLGNGVLAMADGVAVENLTARNYLLNGFFWTGVTGYRGSYLTAHDNADYGLYAFDATDGLFEHSYASGSPDAGFYIGQCYPCRAVIRHVVAENNALGYSGTNAGGDLYILASIWRRNMAGIVPNTLDSELMPPERETTIRANLIIDNNNREAPAKPLQYPALGNGIVIAGGVGNVIESNVIGGHEAHGILVTPNVDRNFWPGEDNVVRGNIVLGSNRADLAVASPGTRGNCFEENRFDSAAPPGLELLQPCRALRLSVGFDLAPVIAGLLRFHRASAGDYPRGEVGEGPRPGSRPELPGGADAPVVPAVDVFTRAGVADAPELPAAARELLSDPARLPSARGPSVLRWAALLPVGLGLGWMALALADLWRGRRTDPSAVRRLAWAGAVVLLPGVGAAAYLLAGRSGWSRAIELTVILGGLGLYLVLLAVDVRALVG